MKFCNNCNVSVAGNLQHCPLCQGNLTGSESEEVFPHIPTIYRQFNFFFKVLMFISITAGVLSAAVNLIFKETGLWSLFVLLGMACVWISLSLAVKKRKNIPKGMLYQTFVISVLCVIWDYVTGWKNWSIDFVIPILCISCIVTLAILSKILNWEIENIIIYFCIDALFGIVPIIFFLTGILNTSIPSLLCVALSFISLAAIIIFKGDSIWAELKRRLSL